MVGEGGYQEAETAGAREPGNSGASAAKTLGQRHAAMSMIISLKTVAKEVGWGGQTSIAIGMEEHVTCSSTLNCSYHHPPGLSNVSTKSMSMTSSQFDSIVYHCAGFGVGDSCKSAWYRPYGTASPSLME